MNCPSCFSAVAPSAVICDSCNHILDASFLGADITNEENSLEVRHDDDATRIRPEAARAAPAPAAVKKAVPKPKAPPPAASLYADEDEPTAHGRAKASLDELAAPSAATTEAVNELLSDFKRLAPSEKLTGFGSLALIASLALPWLGTKDEGAIIGLMGGGLFVGLFSVAILVGLFARRHPEVQRFSDRVLQASMALSALSSVLCVMALRSSYVTRTVRSAGKLLKEPASWPHIGLYIAILAALVMLVGSIKSWFGRDRLPE